MTEAELGKRLGQVLKNIHIPDDVVAHIERSLTEDQHSSENAKKEQRQKLEQRLSAIRQRIDQSYMDKLDGKISEDFWQRKNAEWQQEEQQILFAMQGLEQANPDRLLTAKRTLELANQAYFLYVTQNPAEQGKLLKYLFSVTGEWLASEPSAVESRATAVTEAQRKGAAVGRSAKS